MRLIVEECWARLGGADHGVLGTVHADRGVDLVPVVYAVEGERIVIPVDTVKPKASTRLQRVVNLENDPRCTLLVDRYDDDWSQLWWVRVHATATVVDGTSAALERFPAYRNPGSVVQTIVLAPTEVRGWAATG